MDIEQNIQHVVQELKEMGLHDHRFFSVMMDMITLQDAGAFKLYQQQTKMATDGSYANYAFYPNIEWNSDAGLFEFTRMEMERTLPTAFRVQKEDEYVIQHFLDRLNTRPSIQSASAVPSYQELYQTYCSNLSDELRKMREEHFSAFQHIMAVHIPDTGIRFHNELDAVQQELGPQYKVACYIERDQMPTIDQCVSLLNGDWIYSSRPELWMALGHTKDHDGCYFIQTVDGTAFNPTLLLIKHNLIDNTPATLQYFNDYFRNTLSAALPVNKMLSHLAMATVDPKKGCVHLKSMDGYPLISLYYERIVHHRHPGIAPTMQTLPPGEEVSEVARKRSVQPKVIHINEAVKNKKKP